MNTTVGTSMCSSAMRGCRPPGILSTGTPCSPYHDSILPPLVTASAGDSRSSACMAAVRVSSVSPLYDSSRCRVSGPAQPGR